MHKSHFATNNIIALEHTALAEEYHEKCVSILLPMLHDNAAITTDEFLACSTILRFYEEISGNRISYP